MAFGAELKDFVNGFQAGYKLIDSKEEKEEKRELRQMRKENHERQGKWGEEDRSYRSDRAARSDKEWDMSDSWRREESGRAQGRWEIDQTQEERRLGLAEDELKLNRAKEAGVSESGRMGDYLERNKGIPDGETGGETGGETAKPVAYRDGKISGPQVARAMVTDLQRDFGMPQHIAVGIVGQLAGESGGFESLQEINPTVEGSRGGYGYAQWTGPRRKAFEAFAGRENPDSYDENYAFLKHELQNTSEGNVLNKLRGARDEQEAGRIFTDGFLRPGIKNYEGRSRWTNRVNNLFKKKGSVNAARGGMIEALPEDEELTGPQQASGMFSEQEEQPATEVATALPEEGPMPSRRPSYEGVSEGDQEEKTDDPWEQGRRAVRDGLKQAIAKTGADQDSAISDPELEKVRQQYIRGYGAAPQQMMRQVIDKIDPERQMPAGERNIKAIGTVYQYYLDQGEFDKAKEAAASMVQYYRQTSQQFLALGQAAAAEGDIDKAAQAMIAAYANVPNGRDMAVEKGEDGNYTVTVTDAKTGKKINKTVASPRDIAAQAMNFNPTSFDDEILNAAGAPAEKFDDPSLENTGNIEEAVKGFVEENLAGTEMPAKSISAIQDVATDLATTKENRMGPEQATRFAASLAAFDNSSPDNDKPNYTSKPVRGNPDRVSVTMNGQTVTMSKGQFNNLTGLRGSMQKERQATRETEKKDTEKRAQQMDYLQKGVAAFGEAITEPQPGAAATRSERAQRIRDARSQMGAPIPEEIPAPQGPVQDSPQTTAPAAAIPEEDDNSGMLQQLLRARENALSKPDPERYGLSEIEARLKQLGWKETE